LFYATPSCKKRQREREEHRGIGGKCDGIVAGLEERTEMLMRMRAALFITKAYNHVHAQPALAIVVGETCDNLDRIWTMVRHIIHP
jgi:hypothetical protein